jgi:iron complex transport system permease protein
MNYSDLLSKKVRYIGIAIASIVVLFIICCLSLALGARKLPLATVWNALFAPQHVSALEASIVQSRIPRTIFGVLAGGALGVSGALMQVVTRNPIADPSILGVNTGASLFVVIGLAWFQISSAQQYIWLAILGAGITSILVYGIAMIGRGGATPLKLVLSGAAASTALGSLLSTILLPSDSHILDQFRFWQVGSIGGATWDSIRLISPFFLVGLFIAIVIAPQLNILTLGDEMATSLGVNTQRTRLLAAAAAVLLCGATTALAGPIGFVGLMVPHLVKMLFGAELKIALPFSAISGACLLLFSDIIGRLIGFPGETEVGIITAFLGVPVFIAVIRKSKVNAV